MNEKQTNKHNYPVTHTHTRTRQQTGTNLSPFTNRLIQTNLKRAFGQVTDNNGK